MKSVHSSRSFIALSSLAARAAAAAAHGRERGTGKGRSQGTSSFKTTLKTPDRAGPAPSPKSHRAHKPTRRRQRTVALATRQQRCARCCRTGAQSNALSTKPRAHWRATHRLRSEKRGGTTSAGVYTEARTRGR